MSNYTPVTNFASKDSLATGNALKALKGAELTTEFTAVQAAVNSKFDGVATFAPDGTAVQPSFGFTSNSGTGMYNAAGVLGFATAGLQRVSISVAGAVVVNAPTSGVALTVNGIASVASALFNGGTNNYVQVSDGTIQAYVQAVSAVPSARFGSLTNHKVEIVSNATVALSVDTSQNVNINNGAGLSPVYAGAPQNGQPNNYTLVLSDANKHIYRGGGAASTWTIPANASVAFPIGTMITLVNLAANNTTIAITTDTLTWSPSGASGSRTLAQFGIATIIKTSTAQWVISGSGLT